MTVARPSVKNYQDAEAYVADYDIYERHLIADLKYFAERAAVFESKAQALRHHWMSGIITALLFGLILGVCGTVAVVRLP